VDVVDKRHGCDRDQASKSPPWVAGSDFASANAQAAGLATAAQSRLVVSRESDSESEPLIDRLVHMHEAQAARELLSVGQRRTHRRGIGRALRSSTSGRRTLRAGHL
jgi:hypothetical protein